MAYRNYSPSNGFTVAQDGTGDFLTITDAVAAAATLGGDPRVIFIKQGVYIENFTITHSVVLTTFGGSQNRSNSVEIVGKITVSTNVSLSMYGITLVNNGDYSLDISSSRYFILDSCFITTTGNTSIRYIGSNTGYISFTNCSGDMLTSNTGILLDCQWSCYITNCGFYNSVNSTGISTFTSADVQILDSSFNSALSIAHGTIQNCILDTSAINTTALTKPNAAGILSSYANYILSGTASAIVSNATSNFRINFCIINSSNALAIDASDGATLINNIFVNSAATNVVNTTMAVQGLIASNVSSGGIGQEIIQYISTPVVLTDSTAATIATISLTPGIWDISGICVFTGTPTGTQTTMALSDLNNSLPTTTNYGKNVISTPLMPNAGSDNSMTIPAFRVFTTTAISYYLVAQAAFTVGAVSAYGNIKAIRVS